MNSRPSVTPHRRAWQSVGVIAFVAVVITLLVRNRDSISLDTIIRQQDALQSAATENPSVVIAAAFLVYFLAAALSLPGIALLTIAMGWLLGFWRGLVLVSFASTSGAMISFLTSRFLFHDAIQYRFSDKLKSFNEALAREGALYLFTLRLIPHIPFFVVNLLMGLTPIRPRTFWWVSQIGMLPGTCVYVYAGSTIGNLEMLRDKGLSGIVTWQLGLAFALLGVFPLAAKWIVSAIRPRRSGASSEESSYE
jgi:uncharacterized membrane protein YdjX (TVP38/TMEM64 family)